MRVTRHMRQAITLSIMVIILVFMLFGLSQEEWIDIAGRKADDLRWRLSMTFAYSSVLLLSATLSIGTINLLRGKPNPKHNPFRRALGVMSAILGLAHLAIGITIHTENWDLLQQFLRPTDSAWLPYLPRIDQHGIANYAGLFQGITLLVLVGLSTKWAMKRLNIKVWKNLQRLVYLAFFSIIVHALLYQIIEERSLIIRAIFLMITSMAILLQVFGVLLHIRSRSINTSTL